MQYLIVPMSQKLTNFSRLRAKQKGLAWIEIPIGAGKKIQALTQPSANIVEVLSVINGQGKSKGKGKGLSKAPGINKADKSRAV